MAVQNIHLDTLKSSKFSGTDIIKTFCCAEIFSMEKHSGSKQIFFLSFNASVKFYLETVSSFFALNGLKIKLKNTEF